MKSLTTICKFMSFYDLFCDKFWTFTCHVQKDDLKGNEIKKKKPIN